MSSVLGHMDGSNLGFDNQKMFLKAIDFNDGISTFKLLKVHVSRLILLVIYMIYQNFKFIYKYGLSFWETFMIICNILSLTIFQFEKFIQIIVKLGQISLINVDQKSLNIIFDFYPEPEAIPKSVALILKMKTYSVPKPGPIPQPYLDNEKRIVVPNEREVSEAISLRNEYFTQNRLFLVGEQFRLLSEMSKFILWSAFSTTIEFANIYEPFGISWKENVEESFKTMKELIVSEFNSQLKCCGNEDTLRKSLPVISLIDLNSGYNQEIRINELAEQTEKPEDWIDEDYREFKVYLVDNRIKDLEKLPISTDLIVIPDCSNVKLYGYKPNVEPKTTIIYNQTDPFNLKTFIKGLSYYKRHSRHTHRA